MVDMKTFRYYFFLFLHIALIVAWYTSPFYLDWRIVIVTVVLYHLQIYLVKGCILSRWQFGKESEGFFYHYLRRFGFNPTKEGLSFVLGYIIPGAMIILAVALQVEI